MTAMQHEYAERAPVSRPCPVCDDRASTPLRHLDLVVPEDFQLQHSFSINTCNACGAAFHDIRPFAERDAYYESYTGSGRIAYSVTPDQARLNELTVNFLGHLALSADRPAIADIGCSFGITLMALRQRGYENLFAMDPDRSAIRYLEQQGIQGRTGSASTPAPELEGSFDLILLRHVLEHLYAPREAVDNVTHWLKPGGYLYIELPDLSLFQNAAPFPGFFYEYEHINHFSLYSLLNLMRNFELVQFESSSEVYPCMRALFHRSANERPLFLSTADRLFVEHSLVRPSSAGKELLDRIASLGDREIALWGVSKFVYRLLTHTPLRRCNIRHLVDKSPERQRERLLGMPIQPPETLAGFAGDILVCGANSANSIHSSIRAMGLTNPVHFLSM